MGILIRKYTYFRAIMNTLDIILLICFIPAIFQGLKKGFISQVVSIVSIFAGLWAAGEFSAPVSTWLGQYITVPEQTMKIIAFAVVLIAAFVVLGLVGRLIEGLFKLVMLGWLNKLLGVAFALLKNALIIGLLIIVFNSLNESFNLVQEPALNESVLYPHFKKIAFDVFPYIKDLLTFTK